MADGIQGLFTTPEQYQIMQQQAAQQRALGFAQMNPLERIDYTAYMAGNQLADAAARGLGGQDKQLALISRRQALSKQIDPANPESILAAAQQAAQSGDQQFALTLADYARKSQSEIALAQQRMREGKNAAAPAIQLAEYKGGLQSQLTQLKAMDQNDPQVKLATQTVQSRLDALPVEKGAEDTTEVKNSRAYAATFGKPGDKLYEENYQKKLDELTTAKQGGLKEVGVAEGTRKAVFVDPSNDQQYVYDTDATGKQIRVPYSGPIDRLTSKTDVKVSAGEKRQNKFLEDLDSISSKRLSTALEKRDAAIASLNSLAELKRLAAKPLIGSPVAENILSATNLLNSIGLLGEQDVSRLSSSEQYDKIAKDLVLSTLGNKLGAGISNADRAFIERIVPQLTTSPKARLDLIDFMERKNKKIVEEANRMEKYAYKEKSLEGYQPEITAQDVDAKAARLAKLKKEREDAIARDKAAAKGGGK
jgi:hypothetical protein